jgi:hypothetical protein
MDDKEKQKLYEQMCNDIDCGTFILTPQYVDYLISKYTKKYIGKLRKINKMTKEIE